jgi:hypothetical protein
MAAGRTQGGEDHFTRLAACGDPDLARAAADSKDLGEDVDRFPALDRPHELCGDPQRWALSHPLGLGDRDSNCCAAVEAAVESCETFDHSEAGSAGVGIGDPEEFGVGLHRGPCAD